MNPPPSTALSPATLAAIFTDTAAGAAELRRGVTELPGPDLELLVRLDGALTLAQARQAMPEVQDAEFAGAFRRLFSRGLIEPAARDRFDAMMSGQLRFLAPGEAAQPTQRQAGFSVGLVRRRVGLPRAAGQAPAALVVEDDPMLARFIECFLVLDGFEVRLAANRAEVTAGFRRPNPPDVVLLDVTLPDADGFDVLRRMRAHERLRDVPVIMLTGCATRQGVLQALAAGADGYLTKPFEADALTAAVRAVTGQEASPPAAADPWVNHDALPARLRAFA